MNAPESPSTFENGNDRSPWQALHKILDQATPGEIESFLQQIPVSEWALLVSRLDEEDRGRLFHLLVPEKGAELLEELTETQAVDVMEHLPASEAAAILEELESDYQADLLHQLDDREAEAILAEMEPASAAMVRTLREYPPESAGGLMITELLCFPDDMTVQDVLDDLRGNNERYSDYEVQYAYVVQRGSAAPVTASHSALASDLRTDAGTDLGTLVGVLRLRDLLLNSADRKIANLMIANPLAVPVDYHLNQLVDFFDEHNFLGVPVVDAGRKLVGVVRRYDVETARADRADSDNLKIAGIVGGEELRTMPLVSRTFKRLAWLVPNVGLNILAVSVIAVFEPTIEKIVALAILLPLVSDMGGNAGVQAIAVSIRELNQGLLRSHELLWVVLKESSVGLACGLVLGLLTATGVWVWKQNIYLALVIGVAMALNNLVATMAGGVMPLILRRWGADPALASGPILTTVTDMAGFFFVLSLATLVLPLLS
jgi:magnesium transporter